jgi:hypothetical protein
LNFRDGKREGRWQKESGWMVLVWEETMGERAEGIANHADVEFQGWNEERVLVDGGWMRLAWKAIAGRVGRRDNEPCWC